MGELSFFESLYYLGIFIVLIIMVVKFFNIASDIRVLRTDVSKYIKTHSNEIQPPAMPTTNTQSEEKEKGTDNGTYFFLISAGIVFTIIIIIAVYITR